MTKGKGAAAADLDVPVKFGKVSIGAEVISIPISIDEGKMTPARAHKLFRNSRFQARLHVDELAKNDIEGQQTLVDSERHMDAIVDVSSYRCTMNAYAATLNFKKDDKKEAVIGKFANRVGKVTATRVGEAGTVEE